MGITPNSWGPYAWGTIHLVSLGAPDKIDQALRTAYAMFFNQLPYVLPCATCARHLQENLTKLPVESYLDGKETLFAWSVQLHNIVNRQLGKREMTLEEARKYWEQVCLGENKECKTNKKYNTVDKNSSMSSVAMVLIGMFIGITFMYGYTRFRKGNRRS